MIPLDCPFCGSSELRLIENSACEFYKFEKCYVQCCKCNAQADEESWNTRHSLWISIKDKLPQHKETILAYSPKGHCVCVFIDSKIMNKELIESGYPEEQVNLDKNPYYFCSQEIKRFTLNNVTHWKYLDFPKE